MHLEWWGPLTYQDLAKDTLPQLLGTDVRVIPAPCVGRCEQAPAVQVGQRAEAKATLDTVVACAAELS